MTVSQVPRRGGSGTGGQDEPDSARILRLPPPSTVADLGAGRGPSWLDSWAAAHGADLVSWRRELHAHPELSRQERRTTGFVADRLRAAGLSPRLLPTVPGVVVDIGRGPRMVALRADLDALPLPEATRLPFASTVDGVMHACGHDAHTAVVLGAALALARAPQLSGPTPAGTVRVIFQPAEEITPGGALDVIAAGELDGVERIFALHCDPRLPVGQVGTRVGPITSAADMIELRLSSPGGHTARPHLTADLVHALGAVITGLPTLLSRRVDPRSGTVLVWGAVRAGSAANAVPQEGVLKGSLRTGDHVVWGSMEPLVRELVEALLAPTGVGYELRHARGVPPVVNEAESTAILQAGVRGALGDKALTGTEQSSGGEDFGWFLEHTVGALARLGVWPGSGPMRELHQPTFDLDERALLVGVRTLVHTALGALAAPAPE